MNTVYVRRFATSLSLLVGLAASIPVHARPADPFWHPIVSVQVPAEKPCGPKLERAWYGPRERFVLVGDQGACPKSAPAPKRWAGPRGTVPVYK